MSMPALCYALCSAVKLTPAISMAIVACSGHLLCQPACRQPASCPPLVSMQRFDASVPDWTAVRATGTAPSPRRGHSFVWDGGDMMICFGGTTGTSVDNSVFVYTLSRKEWSTPHIVGTTPPPRTQHAAVMVTPTQMLVFGGCSAAGMFFNDTYILDTLCWTWSKPQPLNSSPAPRYHHSMVVTNSGKVGQQCISANAFFFCFLGRMGGWEYKFQHALTAYDPWHIDPFSITATYLVCIAAYT